MTFNLNRKKIALAPIPPLGDVAVNPDSVFRMSWLDAVNKVMPGYSAQNPGITNIDIAMNVLQKSPEDVMEDAAAINPEMIEQTQEAMDESETARDMFKSRVNSSLKPFNLKKAQGVAPMADPMTTPMTQPVAQSEEHLQFQNVGEFMQWLDTTRDLGAVLQAIVGNEARADHLKEGVERYYQEQDEGEKAKMAALIFADDFFPLKEKGIEIMGQPEHYSEVDKAIKKIAQTTAKKYKAKVFNLKKTAQHKSLDNAILYGPGETRIDPFLHQPVSDWHIVERNKGFGLVVDDIWNIDYETIWRENIMDKYSRPYKDKEGNWVGGYLNKRFEIDRNIPEANNMQLKPGQLRKPILPEYGNTESRLQAARSKGDIEGAIDTSKPFNWKEASKKKS